MNVSDREVLPQSDVQWLTKQRKVPCYAARHCMRNSTALGHVQVVHAGVLTKRSKYIGAWRVRRSAKIPGLIKYLAQCSFSQSHGTDGLGDGVSHHAHVHNFRCCEEE